MPYDTKYHIACSYVDCIGNCKNDVYAFFLQSTTSNEQYLVVHYVL